MNLPNAGNRFVVGSLGIVSMLLVASGCGGPRYAKVTGRVLLDGSPLPGGRITFRPANPKENSVPAEIDERGNYEAMLPVGEVKVCVDNRELAPRAPHGGGVMPPTLPPDIRAKLGGGGGDAPRPVAPAPTQSSRYRALNSRYYTAETSGLEFTVKPGDQQHDILLTK